MHGDMVALQKRDVRHGVCRGCHSAAGAREEHTASAGVRAGQGLHRTGRPPSGMYLVGLRASWMHTNMQFQYTGAAVWVHLGYTRA